ncbi:MAG TPA: DinB family protein [Pyrinomonadaceae bacterium]|nr:DinB family protein [Pyrinomonadaceae bacterium]
MQSSAFANPELLQTLANTPDRVSQLIHEVPDQVLRERDSNQEFSILENVCHLRDIEIDGYTARITRLLTEEHPILADIDGGRLAVERDYNSQNMVGAMQAFTLARKKNVALLRTLRSEEFEREGTLEGVGNVTLGQLLLMMQEHDKVHIAELDRLSAASRK